MPTLKHKRSAGEKRNRGRVLYLPGRFGRTMAVPPVPADVGRSVADVTNVVSVALVKPAEGAE